ncbi:glutathione S-transferase [Glaciecola petra]|uniref:Glutathione S-transferase family protein n=1 Tax=Glaciecola petra TaxID=3075602 RepID=A0ABU2ZWT2_9ALTE|nr:glutathione S-transferase family protein [Aestuariibacter sp. P117]MDT0596483.1 glutathione S-transferase family protein [Aestuariibacter sp. P117]
MSYFAGKLRGYLNYKKIEYIHKDPNFIDLMYRFPKVIGSSSMPVIKTDTGEWLSDTTEIIEKLERIHPQPSIEVTTPRLKIISMLLEAWFDDSWLTPALYTRWLFPESFSVFKNEGGKALLPFFPKFIREFAIEKTGMARMRLYLSSMGVSDSQVKIIDMWLREQLKALDTHFSSQKYLLGNRPTIADYGLLGPMYGHLNRDPWPKKELMDKLPNLRNWVSRTHGGFDDYDKLSANDKLPETLLPILHTVANEFIPMVNTTVELSKQYVIKANKVKGDRLPRQFKNVEFPMGEGVFRRNVFSYTLWMMQRIKSEYDRFDVDQKQSVDALLTELGMGNLMESSFGPKLERSGLGVKLA